MLETMHYMILQWDSDKLQWIVVSYSHILENYLESAKRYPQPEYTHMIDINQVKVHNILEKVAKMKQAATGVK